MLNLKKISGFILFILIAWHIIVAFTPKIKVAGLFLLKPAGLGYVWQNADNADSRFFWQNSEVKWQAGVPHPEFKAETAETEGNWNPLPGYKFVDKEKGLNTVWQPGLLHPDYKAWSDNGEGLWVPFTGYKFIYEGDTFVDTVWDPGKRYEDEKVISGQTQDTYTSFPGYEFVEPEQSLKVVWTPGLVNYENPKLIAGQSEGSWIVRQASYSHDEWLRREVARAIIYRVL